MVLVAAQRLGLRDRNAAGAGGGHVRALLPSVLPGYTFPLWVTFPAICGVSLLGCLIGTWTGRPTDEAVLISFYETVRPFGLWAPIRRKTTLSPERLRADGEGPGRAIANVVIAAVGILAIYLFPMYLVGHWHVQAAICLAWPPRQPSRCGSPGIGTCRHADYLVRVD